MCIDFISNIDPVNNPLELYRHFHTKCCKMIFTAKKTRDMIKRNESDVDNVVFEILAKTVFKFLCFVLFLALTNSS